VDKQIGPGREIVAVEQLRAALVEFEYFLKCYQIHSYLRNIYEGQWQFLFIKRGF
jgi:hypothetical protein